MTLLVTACLCLACAFIPAFLYGRNSRIFRSPPLAEEEPLPPVSILIPARNEALSIRASVEAALASVGVEFEVIVLDDDSEDETANIVNEIARNNPHLRLVRALELPAGWCGKQHACHALAGLARYDHFLFVDADVRLATDGLARMMAFLEASGAELVSGFPRQETGTILEKLLIPLIQFLLLGFLPLHRMRRSSLPAFGAGCGQLFLTRRAAYEEIGGHSAVKDSLHDGITLPRAYRKAGMMTDLCDATDIAICRMYRSTGQVWSGLAKNAREGLGASKIILPATFLLLAGQVMPFILVALLLYEPHVWRWSGAVAASVIGIICAYYPRMDAVLRFRQSWVGVVMHPVGIVLLLAVQWYAAIRAILGIPPGWKGRRYTCQNI